MKMKRVLQISCSHLGLGGVQTVIMDITRNLSERYIFDVIIFSNKSNEKNNEYEKEFISYGGKIFRIFLSDFDIFNKIKYYFNYFLLYKKVEKIVKENGPYDVMHCHNYFEAAPCLKVAKKYGIPIRISHSHNAEPIEEDRSKNPLKYVLENFYRKKIEKYATIKLGCSKNACTYLFKSDSIVLENPIDTQKFNKANYDEVRNEDTYLSVGRFCYQKNPLFMIEIFYEICKINPSSQLTIVGFGGYKDRIINKIEELKLESNVKILPGNSNIPKIMAQNKYFLFPSNYEGFGIVLLEAQAMGMKCFASTNVPRETNVGNCYYIPLENTPKQWAEFIISEKTKKMNEIDLRNFEKDNIMKKYKEIYN